MRHTVPLPSPLSPTKLTTPDPPPTPLHQPPRLRGGARFGCCAIQVWCARCASVERQNIACICCIRRRGRWGGDDYEARGALNTVAAGVKPALHRHLCLFLTFFSCICKNMLAPASADSVTDTAPAPAPTYQPVVPQAIHSDYLQGIRVARGNQNGDLAREHEGQYSKTHLCSKRGSIPAVIRGKEKLTSE